MFEISVGVFVSGIDGFSPRPASLPGLWGMGAAWGEAPTKAPLPGLFAFQASCDAELCPFPKAIDFSGEMLGQ